MSTKCASERMLTRNLSECSRDPRKPIAVSVRKQSVYLQPFRHDFYGGTALWCPHLQISLNLENRDLDRWNQRLMLKISYATCPCLSQLVSAQFTLEQCVLQPEITKKIHKTHILAFKVIQGHWIRWQSRASVRLPIRPCLTPLLRYNDLLAQNRKFFSPPSFNALVRGDPLWIYGKALRCLKLESSRQPMMEI